MVGPGNSLINRRAVVAGALALPAVARAQSSPFRIGLQSILSGPLALLGTSSRNAIQMEVERINAAGGLAGRPVQLVLGNSKGQPSEATRMARDLAVTAGCDMLLDAEASSGSFAVQEVVRDLGILCIHTASETSSLTADPKLRVASAFRCARQGIHDSIVGGSYAAKIATDTNLTKWATCSPDYAYGRATTAQFLSYLKHFKPDIEVIAEVWPKLGAPDFTGAITKILQAAPQALYSTLYAADLSAFINQGNIYGLFGQMAVFAVNMADYPVLTAVKSLPAGINSGNRYVKTFPDEPQNKEWGDAYFKRFNEYPTNWSWQSATAMRLLEAAVKKSGSTDGKVIADALRGLTVEVPFSARGKVTMRADDQTLVDYAIGWGTTVPKSPYVVDMQAGDWGQIVELETEWKKQAGFV